MLIAIMNLIVSPNISILPLIIMKRTTKRTKKLLRPYNNAALWTPTHYDDDIKAVTEALKGDFLTTGPYVKFEQVLCKTTGAQYAVACSNGTTALHLACMA